MKKFFLSNLLLISVVFVNGFLVYGIGSPHHVSANNDLVKYTGKIEHIFFHSLIIYPQKAATDLKNADGYKNNMITVDQFKTIIQQLYDNNFILINTSDLVSFDQNGNMKRNALYLPKAKKPLILSLDDLNYYSYMKNGGFADKLVLDNGIVKTEVITPEGNKIITDDGDVIPIVDQFVKEHPDFSFGGAKGIIGVTGFEGILGYRTQLGSLDRDTEKTAVLPVIEALKKSGWVFASHSFTHDQWFLTGKITKDQLSQDISKWKTQVGSLVGPTNIFIGPFGQVFDEGDPRRVQLLNAGFNVLYGVGMDGYTKFFNTHFVMNRVDLDGYRVTHNPKTLYRLFGISVK